MGLGQKLEDARNRKGISIREATESTKIRSDYLSSFESGDFDINLPVVYLRGFVRLYSRFLGLDQEGVMSELEIELGNVNSKIHKKTLGSISPNDLSEKKQSKPVSSMPNKGLNLPRKLILYLIIGIIFTLSIIFAIFMSSGDGETNNPNELTEVVEEKPSLPTPTPELITKLEDNTLNLAAIGPIERLIVCDEGVSPKKYHEFKSLPTGWEKTLSFKSSFKCYSSSLENLRFAVDDGPEKKAEGSGSGNFSWSE
jgi:cytoskeletal protein RodZ